MLHLSKEYRKILYTKWGISQTYKPPIRDIIDMLKSYDYNRNDINQTVLFLELMHDLIIKNLEN